MFSLLFIEKSGRLVFLAQQLLLYGGTLALCSSGIMGKTRIVRVFTDIA
jgi:hypothetical protein